MASSHTSAALTTATRDTQDSDGKLSAVRVIVLHWHAFKDLDSETIDKWILGTLKQHTCTPKDTAERMAMPLTYLCARYRCWNSLKWLVDNGHFLSCTYEHKDGYFFLLRDTENFCPTRHCQFDQCANYAIVRHGRLDLALQYSSWEMVVHAMRAYDCTPHRHPSQILPSTGVECVFAGPLAFALNAPLEQADAGQIATKRNALKNAAAIGVPMFREIRGQWIPGNHMRCEVYYSSCRTAIEDGYVLFQRSVSGLLQSWLTADTSGIVVSYEDRHPNYVKCTCPLCCHVNCNRPPPMYLEYDVQFPEDVDMGLD